MFDFVIGLNGRTVYVTNRDREGRIDMSIRRLSPQGIELTVDETKQLIRILQNTLPEEVRE